MSRVLPLLTALLLVAALWPTPPATHADGAAPEGWMTDLAKARALAHREKRPLFVVFRCEP